MEEHIVRRLAQAVLAWPGLLEEDRTEVLAVVDDVDRLVRVLSAAAQSLEVVNLIARHERDLLARLHAVGQKYARQAS